MQRGDDWAKTSRVTNDRTGTTTRVTQGSGGGGAVTRNTPGAGGGGVARTGSGDVYAGRDGNVYKNDGGGWQKYDNGSWNSVEKPQGQTGTARPGRDQAGDRAAAGDARTGASAGTLDRSTVDQLNRDRGARAEGTQRTDRFGFGPQQRGRTAAGPAATARAVAAGRAAAVGGG